MTWGLKAIRNTLNYKPKKKVRGKLDKKGSVYIESVCLCNSGRVECEIPEKLNAIR